MGIRRRDFLGASSALIAGIAAPAMARTQQEGGGKAPSIPARPARVERLFKAPVVRVLEARIPPGTEEKPHRHLRGVSVCMTEYALESRTLPDGQWTRNERKLGTVYWSEASLHQVRNVGKTMSHTIRIELKY